MGIQLSPSPVFRIFAVDVVAKGALLARAEVRPLDEETGVSPVLPKGESFGDSHSEDDMALPAVILGAGAEDPVANDRVPANLRLASA